MRRTVDVAFKAHLVLGVRDEGALDGRPVRGSDDLPDLEAALGSAGGFLQRELAADLDLRRTPRLVFTADPLEVL